MFHHGSQSYAIMYFLPSSELLEVFFFSPCNFFSIVEFFERSCKKFDHIE